MLYARTKSASLGSWSLLSACPATLRISWKILSQRGPGPAAVFGAGRRASVQVGESQYVRAEVGVRRRIRGKRLGMCILVGRLG